MPEGLHSLLAHFGRAAQAPASAAYLHKLIELSPRGSRACEILPPGVRPGQAGAVPGATGFAGIWLAQRGVRAEVLAPEPRLLEALGQAGSELGGAVRGLADDPLMLLGLQQSVTPEAPLQLIHHADFLHRYAVPWIQALLARQVALARWVVFTIPSMYAGPEWDRDNARLLPLAEWERILAPFEVEELVYHGGPEDGGRGHILAVVRGGQADSRLRALMSVPEEPYRPGISAIVHTRNEEHNIEACLRSLQGWTDEIIVCDMESEDRTLEVAERYTTEIVRHCPIGNFDRARNVSAMRARHRWVFYLDADERVPEGLGRALRKLADEQEQAAPEESFEALLIPFRHHFAGHWMRSLYPGYTAPRLLKNGRFLFNSRLHSGAEVEGRTRVFPADDPELAIVHYSYTDINHYLQKMARYTDGEAANMGLDGRKFDWRAAMDDFVRDTHQYYDERRAPQDGGHGFIYSFLGGFYRLIQHAKLYENRFHAGQLAPEEAQVPPTLEQVLEYALEAARRRRPAPSSQGPGQSAPVTGLEPARLLWAGPLLSPSGYGEQSRHHLMGLAEAGEPVAAHVIPWGGREDLSAAEIGVLQASLARPLAPGLIHVVHNFPIGFARRPDAIANIGRTVFETDRLPQEWVRACNEMDYVWVSSEFNRGSFRDAGVAAEKLRVFPEALDPAEFIVPRSDALVEAYHAAGKYVFLSVFDWTLHKGWDVLLKAFLRTFEGRDDAVLILKVWSSGYSAEEVRQQAASWVARELGHDLLADSRVVLIQHRMSREELLGLFASADCYVQPSRGEGWGRPYMEAMACGKPVIGTGWSGNAEFMTEANSYLLPYRLQAVPEAGWHEIANYKGHRWAEPDEDALISLLRGVIEERGEAARRGSRAREEVLVSLDRQSVARRMLDEIERVRETHRSHPHGLPMPDAANATIQDLIPAVPGAPGVENSPHAARMRWEGAQFVWHSFAHTNQEIALALLERSDVELSLLPTENPWFGREEDPRYHRLEERFFAPLAGSADVHVRHTYPPHFLSRPGEGRFVLMQPWEYGSLPEDWVGPIQKGVDEVWYNSTYVRDIFLSSGIPEEKLHHIPLGVNTEMLHPDANPYVFTDEPGAAALARAAGERFVFLFVGGTVERKGIDILLEAYRRAFTAQDDVCLIIKDTGTKSVYRGMNSRDWILSLIADTAGPAIVYLDAELTNHQLAGVYTACDCYVHPYRGEGFCMPVLEAMACGLPVVVPAGGPTDDFVDESVGWRVPAEKRPLGIGPDGRGRIGEFQCVGPTWMLEVAVEDLARQMRAIYAAREEARSKGLTAAERVQAGWTWRHTAARVAERVHALRDSPVQAKPNGAIALRTDNPAIWVPPALASASASSTIPEKRESPKISLCMIVRDEERVLGACLASAKPWFDEIIVVDTGSTDRTVEIAREHGAQVHFFPWCDDFSAARNESIRHATGDWIFWMDADDTLPEACGRQLRELALLAEEGVSGFIAQVHIPAAPGETGFTIVDHVKLFRNRPEHRFIGRIHEQILEPIQRAGGRVVRSNVHVIHSGYDYSPEGQAKKRVRDLTILEKDLADRPNHPFVLFNIGMTAFHLKDWDKAVPTLLRCLEVSGPKESIVRKVYAMLAGSFFARNDLDGAKSWLRRGLSEYPHDPELLFRAGIIYREAGDLLEAERCYVHLLTKPETGHIDSLDVTMTGFKAHHNLGLIYMDMSRWDEAERQFHFAVQQSPQFGPAHAGLKEARARREANGGAVAVGGRAKENHP